ncbi:nitrilase-related carbon-nitrogen hydrolase [Candidatus Leptofilum sp.]|uniref:nitrilase-related carbon-nitrogen hydrolase n=1 Tax=Candidatus Leptofilum sp. TaxID=3241576 RepID=UPI003B5A9DE9
MKQKLFSTTTLLLLVFGLLNLFVSGRWTLAVAAWIAPVFALRYLYVHPQRRKFFFYFLVFWITLSIPWYGATPFFGPAHFIFMIITALIGSVPLFADRWLAPKLRRNGRLPFLATLIYPAAGTALELFTSSGSPLGNFGATGYSQYGIPVLTQITAVTGMLGLTFLVSWFPAIVNWAWENNFVWQRVRAGVVAFGVTLLVLVGYGTIRLATAPAIDVQESVTVASFTLVENHVGELNSLLAEEGLTAFQAETQPVHAQYLAKTEEAIAAGAKMILWPELAIIGVEEDVQAVLTQGQAMAQEADVYLAMPVMIHFPNSDRLVENKLFVAGPDGRFVIEHTKYGGNLVEGTLAGSGEIQAVETAYGTLAGIICWDTNFPNTVRQVGQQQADILLSPSKEWDAINPMHAEMAVFRAIENGTALIRQTDEGLSIVVDGYGRTLARGEGLAADGNDLLVEVPTSSPTTIYPVIGDVVGIAAAVGLVVLAIYALFIARRRQQQDVPETAVAIP